MMRTLAIECATQACSAALFEGEEPIGRFHEVIGRGHAEALIPAIAELPDKGRADRILVSLGPGSFTGVRIGLAAARALGLAWQAEVLGYPTLALVVADLCDPHLLPVTACMAGGHGEWFVQNFDPFGLPQDEVQSLLPEEARKACQHPDAIAGSKAQALADLCGEQANVWERLPDASHAIYLPKQLLSATLTPIYGRAPDAALPAQAGKKPA